MVQEKQLNYTYPVDPDSDTAAANVLRFVGKQKKVLEIGAGPGSILRILQEVNQCDTTALEVHPDYVDKLKEFCSNVISSDLNDPRWNESFSEDKRFDVVVAADVLEHLYDPLSCLMNMKTLLNDNGSIVISLPHVGHAAIVGCLCDEDFEYSDWGLLDKTHIRFFGIKNIQSLIEDAQLKIVNVSFVVRAPEQTEFAERWERLPQGLKTEILANHFSYVYQVVLHVVPIISEGQPILLTQVPVTLPKSNPLASLNKSYGLIGYFRNILRGMLTQEQKNKLKSYLK